MLNKVILQGRLVADPELRTTQSGNSVTTFRLACDRNYKDKETNSYGADFINIVAWRQQAEFICKYFNKGSMILVEGSLQERSYMGNDNQRRYVTEVVVDSVYFAGSKRESGSGNNYGQSNNYNQNYNSNYNNYNNNYNNNGYNAPQQNNYNNNVPPTYSAGNEPMPANDFAEYDDDGELPF